MKKAITYIIGLTGSKKSSQRGEIITVLTLIGLGVIMVGMVAGGRLVDMGAKMWPKAAPLETGTQPIGGICYINMDCKGYTDGRSCGTSRCVNGECATLCSVPPGGICDWSFDCKGYTDGRSCGTSGCVNGKCGTLCSVPPGGICGWNSDCKGYTDASCGSSGCVNGECGTLCSVPPGGICGRGSDCKGYTNNTCGSIGCVDNKCGKLCSESPSPPLFPSPTIADCSNAELWGTGTGKWAGPCSNYNGNATACWSNGQFTGQASCKYCSTTNKCECTSNSDACTGSSGCNKTSCGRTCGDDTQSTCSSNADCIGGNYSCNTTTHHCQKCTDTGTLCDPLGSSCWCVPEGWVCTGGNGNCRWRRNYQKEACQDWNARRCTSGGPYAGEGTTGCSQVVGGNSCGSASASDTCGVNYSACYQECNDASLPTPTITPTPIKLDTVYPVKGTCNARYNRVSDKIDFSWSWQGDNTCAGCEEAVGYCNENNLSSRTTNQFSCNQQTNGPFWWQIVDETADPNQAAFYHYSGTYKNVTRPNATPYPAGGTTYSVACIGREGHVVKIDLETRDARGNMKGGPPWDNVCSTKTSCPTVIPTRTPSPTPTPTLPPGVILNSSTGVSCAMVCAAEYGTAAGPGSCVSIGTNTSATDRSAMRYVIDHCSSPIPAPTTTNVCGIEMTYYPTPHICGGKPADWTYCKCVSSTPTPYIAVNVKSSTGSPISLPICQTCCNFMGGCSSNPSPCINASSYSYPKPNSCEYPGASIDSSGYMVLGVTPIPRYQVENISLTRYSYGWENWTTGVKSIDYVLLKLTPTPACSPSVEICDGKDNDCDGTIDEGGVCITPTPTPFHYACVSSRCQTVAGSGTNLCGSDAACITPSPTPFHYACVSSKCQTVAGAGTNLCSIDANCITPTPLPSPWVEAHFRQTNLTPISTNVGQAGFACEGGAGVYGDRYNTADLKSALYNTNTCVGVYTNSIDTATLKVVGVTPVPATGFKKWTPWGTEYFWGWPIWQTGKKEVTFILASPTPVAATNTPTPALFNLDVNTYVTNNSSAYNVYVYSLDLSTVSAVSQECYHFNGSALAMADDCRNLKVGTSYAIFAKAYLAGTTTVVAETSRTTVTPPSDTVNLRIVLPVMTSTPNPTRTPTPTVTVTPTRVPSVTPTITLTPTLTPIPSVTPTPGPSTTTLSFKVSIPRMAVSEVPQEKVKVDIVNSSGTKVYTGSIALVREGDGIYRTKGNGLSFTLGSSGTYRVYVKLTTSVGRSYSNVVLNTGSVLDCTLENTSCGDLKPSLSLQSTKALLLGDTDTYSYNWINIADFDKLVEEFLGRVTTKYTDFNLDNSVDVLDLEVLGLNFNKRGD